MKALRIAAQLALYAPLMAILAYFSTEPRFSAVAPDEALLRLSVIHATQRKEACRERSPEELAKLAPNMRAALDCPRERSPLVVELELDGRTVLRREVAPSGLRRDGNATVYQRMALPAGRHRIVARLRDRAEGDFNYMKDETVELGAGRVLLIDFNASQGGFVFRGLTMKHLGAFGFLLFWILAASGIYLYVRFDTSAAGAYTSIGELEWWFGGVLRSVHRYAADLFVVITLLHLVREAWKGRFRGFRAFTWISGVPLLWLLYASGLIGYWLVWDTRSQFSFSATLESLYLDPVKAEQVSDRLFSLFVFLHIGLPLALLAGMWVHLQRLGRPQTLPPRALAWGLAALLLATAAARPAASEPPWNPGLAPQNVAVDWFYQFIHPLMYATSPGILWVLIFLISAALLVLPYLSKPQRIVAAQVDPANCNGCGRCVADCPYQAVIVSEKKKARVFADRCAACGICAGACPSSTPFRSLQELASGIELPDLTMDELRRKVQAALAGGRAEVVFACEANAKAGAIALRCLAMLPPAFVEYALRNGARRVRVIGCEDECAYRLGMDLSAERFAGRREPHLRATVRAERHGNEYTFALL